MTLSPGLVRLVAVEPLFRAEGQIRRGTRFLASPDEARQLLQAGLARHDEAERQRSLSPWVVRGRR